MAILSLILFRCAKRSILPDKTTLLENELARLQSGFHSAKSQNSILEYSFSLLSFEQSDKGYIWMGYEFESIGNCSCGEICRITGFIESDERISPELVQSNLVGSIVLFSKYNRYLKKEEKVTVEIIRQLLDL